MKIRILLLALLTTGLGFTVACGDLEEDCAAGDTNDAGEVCVCAAEDGTSCDPEEDDDCTCAFPAGENNGENNGANNGTNNGTNNGANNGTNNGVPANNYRFVLVEDLTASVAGAYPGVDLDAVQLTKASGGINYATAVDDFNLADNNNGRNEATNVNAATGAPDDGCSADDTKFVALGGVGGYIVVSFGTDAADVTVENGDSIVVHEIGRGSCPASSFDDDPYALSVSVSSDAGFIELATGAEGVAPIPVTGLP
jgi:hypothetical protein